MPKVAGKSNSRSWKDRLKLTMPVKEPATGLLRLVGSNTRRLRRLFRDKDWWDRAKDLEYEDLFRDLHNMLLRLETEQQDLLLDLLEDYLLFSKSHDYAEGLRSIIQWIVRQGCLDGRHLIVVPITSKGRGGQSGPHLVYEFASKLQSHIGSRRIQSNAQIVHFAKHEEITYKKLHNCTILFLDDYIGTGETATNCISSYQDSLSGKQLRELTILCAALVSQRQGFLTLREYCDDTYSYVLRDRGITDSDKIQDKQLAMERMKEICVKLGVGDPYQLGYNESEALVTLLRTPNNTFGAFWNRELVPESRAPFHR